MPIRAALLLLSFASTTTAQSLTSCYLGPTLGVSTPDFGHPVQHYFVYGTNIPFEDRRAPIPSPLAGVSAGVTMGKHLALDAALQYSYTGQRFRRDYPQSDNMFYKERLWIHKIALPVTFGYARNLGRTHFRVGLGGSAQYLLTSRVIVNQSRAINGVPVEEEFRLNPLRDGLRPRGLYSRLQIHPRASFSAILGHRLMLTAAYSHGKKYRSVGFYWGLYSPEPRNSAIDLTITYLLKSTLMRRGDAPASETRVD